MPDVTVPWPAPTLPGVCVRSGLPTQEGLLVKASGTGERVVVPLHPAVQLRWRALGRIRAAAAVIAVLCFVGAGTVAWWLAIPAVVALIVAAYAGFALRTVAVHPRVIDGTLVVPQAHPEFVRSVAAIPGGRCGSSGGCATCISKCVPQVERV